MMKLALVRALIVGFLLLASLLVPPASATDGFEGDVGPHDQVGIGTVTFATGTSPGDCNTQGSVTSITFSHSASGTNGRFLEVAVMWNLVAPGFAGVSSITYAGQALSVRIGQSFPGASSSRIEVWDLTAPPIGTANVVVTFDAAAEAVMVVAISFFNVDVFSRQQSEVAGSTNSISTLIQTGIPPTSANDFGIAYVGFDASTSSTPPTANSPQTLQGSSSSRIAGPRCHHLAVSTLKSPGLTFSMGYTANVNGDWALIARVLHPTTAAGEIIATRPLPIFGGGAPAQFAPGFDALCSLSAFDWLVLNPVSGHRDVSIYDGRPEAALATLYVITWGDDKQDIVAKTPVNHTYVVDGIYRVVVRTQYTTGPIDIFIAEIDTRGNNCALQMFVRDFMPPIILAGALSVIAALVVTVAKLKVAPDRKKLLRKAFLINGVVIFAALLAIILYGVAQGVPI